MTAARTLALVALYLAITTVRAAAQSAAPSPSPSAAPHSEQVWHNPVNTRYSIFDPCGGPKELFSKLNPSPCVLVMGEAEVSFGYANVNTHGTIGISGPLQRGTVLPISGNVNLYPLMFIALGVSPSSQLQITVPSQASVSTQRLGSTGATTDTSFSYKQFAYFSPTKFTMAAVDLTYTAPTGGSSLGPTYQIQPQLAQPLNVNTAVGAYWSFKNAASPTSLSTVQRTWSDPIGLYVSWSPAQGGFALLPIVEHQFNPNRTIVLADAAYLFNRHFLLNVIYGGLGVSTAATGPLAGALTFTANANPRIFTASVYYLIGESNLPPEPPAHP